MGLRRLRKRLPCESDYINTYDNGLSYGARVTAAGWSENAYPGHSKTNPAIDAVFGPIAPTSNYGAGGNWSSYAKRYTTGTSGELLDAFVFSGFKLGSTSVDVKLGKHTVAWGEALYADGVNVGQSPIDQIKGASSPGAQTKEIFMPLNQLSANWQLNSTWAILGDYQLAWAPTRNLPAGTFFGSDASGDLTHADPLCASTAPKGTCINYGKPIMPSENGGSYGIAARYSPEWLDGSMGFYYRKFDELNPWQSLQLTSFLPTVMPTIRLSYARDTELFGFSATHNMDLPVIGLFNGAVEFVYKKNAAFASSTFSEGTQNGPVPTLFANAGVMPTYAQVEGARGNTYHLILNGTKLLNQSFWYETGTLTAEVAYQRVSRVTKNAKFYKAEGYAGCPAGQNVGDGCATKDNLKAWVLFKPQWMNALPGIDFDMPVSASLGIFGNTPIVGGQVNEGAYTYSIGLNANYQNKYTVGMLYGGGHKNYKTKLGTGADALPGATELSTSNGAGANLNSHRWFDVNFKTTF